VNGANRRSDDKAPAHRVGGKREKESRGLTPQAGGGPSEGPIERLRENRRP